MRPRSAAFARKRPPETAVFATAFASQPPAQLCRLSAQNQRRGGHGLGADPIERAVSGHQARTGRMSTFGQHSTPKRDLRQFRRLQIGSRASAAHSQHFPGQKLRLGGHGLGADPTYLLYLPSRSRGGLRRIDLGPDCASATLSNFSASIDPQASAAQSWHLQGQKLRLGGDALGAGPTYLLYHPSRSHGGI